MIKILKDKTENDVLNSPKETTKGYQLYVKSLMTLLTPKAWLKDAVIQNYLALLMGNLLNKKITTTVVYLHV